MCSAAVILAGGLLGSTATATLTQELILFAREGIRKDSTRNRDMVEPPSGLNALAVRVWRDNNEANLHRKHNQGPPMSQLVSSSNPPAALSSDKVRSILNQWSQGSFFRIKTFGDRIALDKVTAHSSFTIRLRTQLEDRSTSQVTAPYNGGYVDNTGRPPDLWAINVRKPTDFEDRTEKVPVPHTEEVRTCTVCTGMGMINCQPCQGWGKVNCPQCQGRGYVDRVVSQPPGMAGPGFQQTPQPPQPVGPMTQTVRQTCQCFAGKVQCLPCQGRGKVPCATCSGSGRIKHFEQLTVHFHVDEKSQVLNSTEVPEHLMNAASGTALVDERASRIDTLAPVNAEVDRSVRVLLQKSHAIDPDASQLLFQRW